MKRNGKRKAVAGGPKTRPGSTQERVRATYKNKKLAAALYHAYGRKPLRALASDISARHGVRLTHGTLHRALNGIESRQPELRRALGLATPAAERLALAVRLWGALWGGHVCPRK